MPSDDVDEELGGGSVAPSPTRFELQEDPRLLEEHRASRVTSISLHAVSSPFPLARFLLH
jgi:kinesin family protein 15